MPFHRAAEASSARGTGARIAELALLAVFATVLGVAAAFGVQFASQRGGWLADPARRILFEPLLILAATLPAAPLAAACTGRRPTALLSVERRIRAGALTRALAITAGVYATVTVLALAWGHLGAGAASAVDTATPGSDGAAAITATGALIGVGAYVLLGVVVALQTAAEELVFRAALPQILGARALGQWGASAIVAYGLPALAFVALHSGSAGTLADVAVFAACAALLTWRTAGIEAAWALHLVGNVWIMWASISNRPLGTLATVVAAALIVLTSPRR